jgi:hypothetical protein
MSDLQIGLILLGIALILVVLLFNWWQDRRIRQKMQAHFPENDHDPLMNTVPKVPGRKEPALGVRQEEGLPADDAVEVDPATQAVIDIHFAQPVSTAALHAVIQNLQKVGSKPLRIFAEKEGGGHRMQLRADEHYVSMQLAVLLANRNGPLSDIEWSQLWTLAQSLAERFDGAIEAPEQVQVLDQARRLDAVCAGLDVQVGLVLRLQETYATTDIIRVLKDIGFLSYGRQLAWMSDTGLPRFTVMLDGVHPAEIKSEGVNRIDLLLDLPNSPSDEHAFSRMASVGRDLARRLDAELLDDQGNPVHEQADQAIDEQLAQMYAKLDEEGFPAGSDRAARVFS